MIDSSIRNTILAATMTAPFVSEHLIASGIWSTRSRVCVVNVADEQRKYDRVMHYVMATPA